MGIPMVTPTVTLMTTPMTTPITVLITTISTITMTTPSVKEALCRSCKVCTKTNLVGAAIQCFLSVISTGIFLHILADTLGSVGVIISSLLIYQFG